MFHTIYKITVFLLIPIMCIAAEASVCRKSSRAFSALDSVCKWGVFWSLGVSAVTTGLMQMLNPSYTAVLLCVSAENYVVIRELGFANFSMGIPAVLSLKCEKFRQPAALTYGLYLFLCVMIHFSRVGRVSFEEIMSAAADICGVIIAVLAVVGSRQKI